MVVYVSPVVDPSKEILEQWARDIEAAKKPKMYALVEASVHPNLYGPFRVKFFPSLTQYYWPCESDENWDVEAWEVGQLLYGN